MLREDLPGPGPDVTESLLQRPVKKDMINEGAVNVRRGGIVEGSLAAAAMQSRQLDLRVKPMSRRESSGNRRDVQEVSMKIDSNKDRVSRAPLHWRAEGQQSSVLVYGELQACCAPTGRAPKKQ